VVWLVRDGGEPRDEAVVARDVAARGERVRLVQEVEADLAGEGLVELGEGGFVFFEQLRGCVRTGENR
jgi:hypothetical protein